MPKVLKDFLEHLSGPEADLIAEWLDETPEPAVEMVRVIAAAQCRRRS